MEQKNDFHGQFLKEMRNAIDHRPFKFRLLIHDFFLVIQDAIRIFRLILYKTRVLSIENEIENIFFVVFFFAVLYPNFPILLRDNLYNRRLYIVYGGNVSNGEHCNQ